MNVPGPGTYTKVDELGHGPKVSMKFRPQSASRGPEAPGPG